MKIDCRSLQNSVIPFCESVFSSAAEHQCLTEITSVFFSQIKWAAKNDLDSLAIPEDLNRIPTEQFDLKDTVRPPEKDYHHQIR